MQKLTYNEALELIRMRRELVRDAEEFLRREQTRPVSTGLLKDNHALLKESMRRIDEAIRQNGRDSEADVLEQKLSRGQISTHVYESELAELASSVRN